jgi:hypothetical protein
MLSEDGKLHMRVRGGKSFSPHRELFYVTTVKHESLKMSVTHLNSFSAGHSATFVLANATGMCETVNVSCLFKWRFSDIAAGSGVGSLISS